MVCAVFFQMTSIGYFIVMVQNMLTNVKRFAHVFSLFQIMFSLLFFLSLTSYGTDCKRGHPGFDGLIDSMFGIFGMMLNTLSMLNYDIDDRISMWFLNIVYVIVVPITLINLLIALFSECVSRVSPYKEHILAFQRILMSEPIEYFLYCFAPRYLERKQKDVYASENGRFYLVVTDFCCPI